MRTDLRRASIRGDTLVHQRLRRSIPLFLSVVGLCGCASLGMGVKQNGGLTEVDALLNHVERVQVEAAVSKERAQAALENLRGLLAPEFKGDPIQGHAQLVAAVERSEEQADALRDDVKPLRSTGDSVFERWTADLESFGNIAMRQRSQERLEETRRLYDAILAATVAAQLAYDAFNGDLRDHALFLAHDFNSTSVALIAQELDGLRARGKELAKRLDGCAAACQAYVEFAAPQAQVEPDEPAAQTPAPQAAPAAPAAEPAPAKKTPLKKKPTTKPTQGAGG